MDYLKIAEIAQKCNVKQAQILEHYRMIGANPQFPKEVVDTFYAVISDMEAEKTRLEKQLWKLVK